jgi:hypothetical protein
LLPRAASSEPREPCPGVLRKLYLDDRTTPNLIHPTSMPIYNILFPHHQHYQHLRLYCPHCLRSCSPLLLLPWSKAFAPISVPASAPSGHTRWAFHWNLHRPRDTTQGPFLKNCTVVSQWPNKGPIAKMSTPNRMIN